MTVILARQPMKELEELIEILTHSVKKHGPKTVLTLGHLLSICKQAERRLKERAEQPEYIEDID